jgi:hypothetical protein
MLLENKPDTFSGTFVVYDSESVDGVFPGKAIKGQ